MKLVDITEIAFSNMRKRKIRSWLTILGIVIAVAAIVSLMSIAFGVEKQISSSINQMGNDIIQITPGSTQATNMRMTSLSRNIGFGMPPGAFGRGQIGGRPETAFRFGGSQGALKFSDAEEIKKVSEVEAVDARIQERMNSVFKGKNASLSIIGVEPDAFKKMTERTDVIMGRMLSTNDRYSVLLGFSVYNNTFKRQDMLNRQITIGNHSYKIVGVLNQSSDAFIVSDNSVYIPIEVAKQVMKENEEATQILVKVREGADADEVAARIHEKLLELHRLPEGKEDFTITTPSYFKATISSILNTLALFLGGIAAISLLVGAIGVANTMYMSVLERTKEIGVLKAIGMKDSEVTAMFLIESAAMGIAGGAIGIMLSFLVTLAMNFFGLPTSITIELIIGSLAFSTLVGIIAGAFPSRNAAKLQPVEALMYE